MQLVKHNGSLFLPWCKLIYIILHFNPLGCQRVWLKYNWCITSCKSKMTISTTKKTWGIMGTKWKNRAPDCILWNALRFWRRTNSRWKFLNYEVGCTQNKNLWTLSLPRAGTYFKNTPLLDRYPTTPQVPLKTTWPSKVLILQEPVMSFTTWHTPNEHNIPTPIVSA
jgi:hypothetical protein